MEVKDEVACEQNQHKIEEVDDLKGIHDYL
jgi:hypothetical protein